jgi:uncharacterized protein YegJ (DUF2314 family)
MQQTTLYSPSLLIFVQRDSSRVRAFSSSAIPQRLASPREYRAVKPSWRAVSPVNLVSFVRHSPSSVVLPTDQARCRFCLMQDNLRTISLIALVAAPVIAGLTLSAQAANVVAQELKQGSTEPPYFQVPKDQHHAAMQLAVKEARKTVEKFITALEHPGPGQQDFEVKKPFIQGNQVEHIWLSDVRFIGKRFQGRIDNQPRKIGGLKVGQIVSVSPRDISDWLYIDNGKLVGGYTVRVHYNELSPQQKQEFDRQANFKIERP